MVTRVGRDSERGFLRMIRWKDIHHLAKKIENGKLEPPYLGVSVKASEDSDGLYVLRISSDSPLVNQISMGDRIMTANLHTVNSPDDLVRVFMLANKKVCLEVRDAEGKKKTVKVEI